MNRIGNWEYSCDEGYFEEFNKGNILKYSLLLAALPQNRLDLKKSFQKYAFYQ